MIKIRKSDEIYHKSGDWFGARWHFSFDDYYGLPPNVEQKKLTKADQTNR